MANSRFLILPHVRVAHLASHILGKLVRQLPGDWEAIYGELPLLLETFMEDSLLSRTCFPGRRAGRRSAGRQDWGERGNGAPVKKVFLYPLSPEGRSLLRNGSPVFQLPAIPVPVQAIWAEEEFLGFSLSDNRLADRLLSLARYFFARPTAQLP